ncbi:carboxypeptidase regulatory-like domain-containing protein [Methylolobus aquaticus]|nr:carboxypeptidase regulatory-like domain-containing protein [Methylolobus aquaticus]
MKYRSKASHDCAIYLRWRAAIFAPFLCVCISTDINAQTIRGRLMKGPYPIAGIAVNVSSPMLGASGFAYSGPDGMYYLFNIAPGPYTLQVWDIPNMAPMQFQIAVYPQPWIDIAPIQLR